MSFSAPFRFAVVTTALLAFACDRESSPASRRAARERTSVLLVTLDTTRADAIGPDAAGVETPSFNGVAARGRRFRFAYASVPETLPSHVTMMTGVYPAAHGVHENGRELPNGRVTLAEHLRNAGYHTAAFISGYPLNRRFGIARGFDLYDDTMTIDGTERSARETTDKAVKAIAAAPARPVFFWVHYFDPHFPYAPPEPFDATYASRPYLGEVAAMDEELGRLLEAFRRKAGANAAIVIVGDHGESLGEHGEAQHGNLVYDGAMRVPLVIEGPEVSPSIVDTPVSIRRVFHTILDWAGLGTQMSLRGSSREVVTGEAMKPFLSYGWQPQIMVVENRLKVIHAGKVEAYDLVADPGETKNIAPSITLSRDVRRTLREYPVPSLAAQPPAAENLNAEERRRLASLGYVASLARPVIRQDAPRPRDMAYLFDELDLASGLFVREEYRRAIPLLEKIFREDPENVSVALRLAAANSALGRNDAALDWFAKAKRIAPESPDVLYYLALHYVRTGDTDRALPILEPLVRQQPSRSGAVEALAVVHEREGKHEEALELRQRLRSERGATPAELVKIGALAMSVGNTPVALQAFEEARAKQSAAFAHDLELGVLYLQLRRFEDARDALDRVPSRHPAFPMALFKRAQVSVLLNEPDRAQRIAKARANADETTHALIQSERLFAPVDREAPASPR